MSEEDKRLSDEFVGAFCNHGSSWFTCDCGRTHFCSAFSGDFDSLGELDELVRKEKEDPDKYIDAVDTTISVIYVAGQSLVVDCPCNRLLPFEDFVWRHRVQISRYLKRRMDNILEQAECEIKEINEMMDAVKGRVKRDEKNKERS